MNDLHTQKRLRKSRTDRMIDGVCGGIAAYFNIDATLVRVLFVILALAGGAGLLLYLAAMILMPIEPVAFTLSSPPRPPRDSSKFWGFLLIGLGVVWLLGNVGVSFWYGWWHMEWQVVLAILLITAGALLMTGSRTHPVPAAGETSATGSGPDMAEAPPPAPPAPRKLTKSRMDRKLFGVCGGLGAYFGVDSTVVRLVFVILVFATHGLAILAYILLAILAREEVITPQAV